MYYKSQKQDKLISVITEKINDKLTSNKFTTIDVLAKLEDAFVTWGLENADFVIFLEKISLLDAELVTDADEFANIVTMYNSTMETSWGSIEEEVEEYYILLDPSVKPLEVGENTSVTHASKEKVTTLSCPDFDTEQEYCILLSEYTYSEYNTTYSEERTYSLYVYNPKAPA